VRTRPGALDEAVERQRLARRLSRAVSKLEDPAAPVVVVDLDAFDANAADLVRRADGKPVRVAPKSVRVPALLSRVLGTAGFRGVLSYSLREALWLVGEGVCDDVVMGYPTADLPALRALLADDRARGCVTLMVDSPEHLDLIETAGSAAGLRVALDVDAGLRLGPAHVGPKRSPLARADDVVTLARDIVRRGFTLAGVMTYEGQVAGVPDEVPHQQAKSFVVRRLKTASIAQLAQRRRQVADALAGIADLEFWNAGGSGSVETTAADPVVTEVAAGARLGAAGVRRRARRVREDHAGHGRRRGARRCAGRADGRSLPGVGRPRAGGSGGARPPAAAGRGTGGRLPPLRLAPRRVRRAARRPARPLVAARGRRIRGWRMGAVDDAARVGGGAVGPAPRAGGAARW
jgi:D-serine deaminase-like pyridoxal phosphate-dependent protein